MTEKVQAQAKLKPAKTPSSLQAFKPKPGLNPSLVESALNPRKEKEGGGEREKK